MNIGFTNEKPAGFSGDDAGRMVQDLLAGTYDAQSFAQGRMKKPGTKVSKRRLLNEGFARVLTESKVL